MIAMVLVLENVCLMGVIRSSVCTAPTRSVEDRDLSDRSPRIVRGGIRVPAIVADLGAGMMIVPVRTEREPSVAGHECGGSFERHASKGGSGDGAYALGARMGGVDTPSIVGRRETQFAVGCTVVWI